MKINVKIYLDEDEIREAIVNAAVKKIDLGEPFDREKDVALYCLNLKTAEIEIFPQNRHL